MSDACPCGTDRAYDDCCAPFHAGRAHAPTAEALMRSRYSAYAKGEIDYIISTHEVKEDDIDRAATEEWSKKAEWKGLEIRATEAGGESDAEGMVEFVAKYRQEGKDLTHHERSRFRKTDGQWKYVEGAQVKPAPVKAAPKTGRNEPCPCGSGKKYKKCHGGAEA